MVCIKLFDVPSIKKDKEINEFSSDYRLRLKITAYKLMKEFELISTIEGDDIPEFFLDKKTGTCCVLFSGDSLDLNMLEDYLYYKRVYENDKIK